MIEPLVEKLVETEFGDVFKPAGKEELVAKRGWALFNNESSDVVKVETYDEVKQYSNLSQDKDKMYYRTGLNFYGVTDRKTGDTFLVTVSLDGNLQVYDSSGASVKYFME